jgi:hypothetical protein
MPELTCQRCGHAWEYTGESDYWATCPRCRTNVKVERTGEEGEGEDASEPVPTVAGMQDRVERLEEQVETAIDAQAEVAGDLREERGELEERIGDLETAVVEISEVLEELIVGMDGRVDYESEALANPDRDPEGSVSVPEAVKNAGVYDPTEEG